MELWDGKVRCRSLAGFRHGLMIRRIDNALNAFVERHRLGVVIGHTGFRLNALRVVGPDLALIPRNSIPQEDIEKAVPGSPALAIEVISPNDKAVRLGEKVLGYFEPGASRVWTVEPRHQTVTVHRPGGEAHTYLRNGTLKSDDAGVSVPGFELTLEQIFSDDV
jgi:Uma2 family endonuclease